ncbi:ribose-5-phosphate isomerase RpiA [Sphingomonas sp.]|uniref:ribose-5-phosphate isomerase RpiA n=1 Tax=Sphingomonas sp. TaxID=28214 RepID=UPI003AFF8F83
MNDLAPDPQAEQKRGAAEAAVAEIADGMIVGLGTGSTAAFAIKALGRRVAAGLRVTAAATSLATERTARAVGVAVVPFEEIGRVDLCIDGADEVDPAFRAIKGAGGALLREKVVAASAARMICIIDAGKLVERLGTKPLPIEVLPFAHRFVADAVRALGADPVTRGDAAGRLAASDQGNLLIDCHFGAIPDPEGLAQALDGIPGLLGHGLFLAQVDALFVGATERRERPMTGP